MFLEKLISLKNLMLLSAQDDFINRELYYKLKHYTCLHYKNYVIVMIIEPEPN
jgi:hypothetical protein